MTEHTLEQWRNSMDQDMQALTSQVSGLTLTVGELVAYQRSQGDRFDRMADAFEQDRQIAAASGWSSKEVATAFVGGIATVCVLCSALLYGINENTRSEIAVHLAPIAGITDWMKDKDEFQRQVHYESGVQQEESKWHEAELGKLWLHVQELKEVDREHDKKLAIAETSRRAIGDYVKEHSGKPQAHPESDH